MTAATALNIEALSDIELAQLCAARDKTALRHVITNNNQRLFRTAWSILKDRGEAEEAVQAAYLSAFSHIDGFAGRSSLSTWLPGSSSTKRSAGCVPGAAGRPSSRQME